MVRISYLQGDQSTAFASTHWWQYVTLMDSYGDMKAPPGSYLRVFVDTGNDYSGQTAIEGGLGGYLLR